MTFATKYVAVCRINVTQPNNTFFICFYTDAGGPTFKNSNIDYLYVP